MARFLTRLGVPDRCFELIAVVLSTCESCSAFQPVPRRPRYGAELAGFFGDIVVCDLFYISGLQFILLIDEATRYKVAAILAKKDASTLGKVMLHTWIKYFGPPKILKSD